MGWSRDVEGGEVLASAISTATRWSWRGWEDDNTEVSSVLHSVRASPPYSVSDGDPVPTDESPVDLLGDDCKGVVILVQTLHFGMSF